MDIPELVFIVPYRDREQQYMFFRNHMKSILSDIDRYRILYIHQKDDRTFNRGAIKNIGFLYVKETYPLHYKDITLVFNDIDTMPFTKNFFDYKTKPGVVKHFYGFNFALGGIVSINASDFENVNGFPNLWSWGYEDNELHNRCLKNGLQIDRTHFYPILDKNILMLSDGIKRTINKAEINIFKYKTDEGIRSINNIRYAYNSDTDFVDVSSFDTGRKDNDLLRYDHDMREPITTSRRPSKMKMLF